MNARSDIMVWARRPTTLALMAAMALAACNGGADRAPTGTTPAASLEGQVALGGTDGRKGVLTGATVCADLDGDGLCSPGEPQTVSGSDGRFAVSAAHSLPLVAEVPASASRDGVMLGTSFTLRAPAGSASLSPLSTLVVAEMELAGGSAAEAAERLRARGGLAASPLEPLADGDAARVAAALHRLGHWQRETLSGSGLPAHDIAREIDRVQATALADIAAAARDGAGDDTLRAIAQRLGPSAAQVAASTRVFALGEPPAPATPEAGGALAAFSHTDADRWFLRMLQSSDEDTVVDGSGRFRYIDVYTQSARASAAFPNGIVQRWNGHPTQARAGDLHFDGSGWRTCGGITDRFGSTPRDAFGRNSYDYCHGYEVGEGIRRVEDVSGQDIADVFREKIRTFPGGSGGVAFANWGPSDLTPLSGRVFPAGSNLQYQMQRITATAATYDPRDSNRVLVFSTGVAAGGDTRVSPSLDCNNPTLTASSAAVPVTSLESMVALMAGRPCIFAPGGVSPDLSLDPDEWWGNSSVNMGDLAGFNALPPGTGAYYNTTASLRVSFTTGGRARFHRCFRRASDGGPRNCSLLGLGTWKIETLGDARVLSFSTMPAVAQRLGYNRVFVERGGFVYYGFKNPVGVSQLSLRLSLAGANAVFEALGLPAVRPIRQPGTATGARATALATLQGAWGADDGVEANVFRFGPDGRVMHMEVKPYAAVTIEQSGVERGWLDVDPATGRASALLELDTSLSSGLSHPSESDPPLTVSDTTITSGSFSIGRMPDGLATDPTSLVGLWALDAPGDLAAAHIAFFPSGRAVFAEQTADADCLGGDPLAAGQCPPGAEYATYTWDPATGVVVFTLIPGETTLPSGARHLHYDTNGCQGLFAVCPRATELAAEVTVRSFTFTLAPDGRSIGFLDDDRVPRTLHRVPTR